MVMMFPRHTFFFFLFAICISLFQLSSCKTPNDGIPFYMQCDSVTVVTSIADSQGVNSKNISDVWVEANTDNLGAYELPCNFPVLQENTVRFVLSAGVHQSGQAGVRVIYPMYSVDTFSISATRAGRYSHTPVFKYKNGVRYTFLPEDFEIGNAFNGVTLATDTNVKFGNRCAVITVSPADSSVTSSQTQKYDWVEGNEIWLEVDYKCEVPFWVGYFGNYSNGQVARTNILFVNTKPTWNKLYVKLSESVASVRADSYNLFFEGLCPSGTAGGKVYLDNIKLLQLQN